jgi:hypothetical protein
MSKYLKERRPQIALAMFAVALFAPSSQGSGFDGLPLSNSGEQATLFLILAILASNDCRQVLKRIFLQMSTMKWRASCLVILCITLLKVSLFAAYPIENAFTVCYRSLKVVDGMTTERQCEPTFEALFLPSNASGTVEKISFGFPYTKSDNGTVWSSNWDLPFVNDGRFVDDWDGSNERPPFRAIWTWEMENLKKDLKLPIAYRGEGNISVNNKSYVLKPIYRGTGEFLAPLEMGQNRIRLSVSFDSSPIGPSSYLGPFAAAAVFNPISAIDASRFELEGWSLNTNTNEIPKRIDVIVGYRVIQSILIDKDRQDVAHVFQSGSPKVGFSAIVDSSEMVSSDGSALLVAKFRTGKSVVLGRVNTSGEFTEQNFAIGSIDRFAPSSDEFMENQDLLQVQETNALSKWLGLLVGLIFLFLLAILALVFFKQLLENYRVTIWSTTGLLLLYLLSKIDLQLSSDFRTREVVSFAFAGVVTVVLVKIAKYSQEGVCISASALLIAGSSLILLKFENVGYRVYSWVSTTQDFRSLNQIVFRERFSDWVRYQSQARDMLHTGFLRGGEDVFYMQPGFRYVLYTFRRILGDGDPYVSSVFLFLIVFFGVRALNIGSARIFRSDWLQTLLLWGFISIAFSWIFVWFISVQASEVGAWLAVMAAGALLVRRMLTFSSSVTLFSLLAISVCVRPNHIVGVFSLVFIVLFFKDKFLITGKMLLASVLSFLVILLLPLAHNWIYGGRLVLFSTGRPGLIVPWGDFLDASSFPKVLDTLSNQFAKVAYLFPATHQKGPSGIEDLPDFGISFQLYVAFGVIVFVAFATLFRLRRWRRLSTNFALIYIWPLMYLLSMLNVRIGYQPKHTLIFYLSLFLASAVVITRSKFEVEEKKVMAR